MLPKLTHASKLRVEVEGWRAKARTLQDTLVTKKVLKLTDELIYLAKSIDDIHDTSKNGFINPALSGDPRDRMHAIRLEVTSLLKNNA